MLGQQRGAKIVEHRLRGPLQGSGPDTVLDPVVGGAPAPSMNHRSVTLFPESLAKSAEVAV
jgi:hypothetical protein